MRFLLADDEAILRAGLKHILAETFPEAQFGEAETTDETLKQVRRGRWDAVILDLFMPGRGGLDVLEELKSLRARPPVLVLSTAPEEQAAIRVLQAGASGYLSKETSVDQLIQAVKKVLGGGKYVGAAALKRLVAGAGQVQTPTDKRLSDREFHVLRLILAGKSLKQIAGELSLSAKTISTFHTRIWEKLGVENDVELVYYALEHRLTSRGRSLGGAEQGRQAAK